VTGEISEFLKMRIIVATACNNGPAEYQNMGDVAMLQVAVARLFDLWPDGRIEVLTDSPANLARYCPGAIPLSRAGSICWVADRVVLGHYHKFLPKRVSARLSKLKRIVGRRWPSFLELLIRVRLNARDMNCSRNEITGFVEAMKKADLLVVSGSGGFADSCREWNISTLNTMETAIRRGIPVVMFGQGIGPLSDPEALSRARDVFPKVTLITLRGTHGGRALLEAIGASAEVRTTGDEAIELAYSARANVPGSAVGINLRVASYAGVESDATVRVAAVLQEFARRNQTALLPIPIAFHEYAQDHEAIRQLLAGFDDESDGGLLLDTPMKVIKQTALCKIVVTGAYHAAVFALAQGIPVVCLSNSPYYFAKFKGLEDLFGSGCTVVTLSDPDFPEKLAFAIDKIWNLADGLRVLLLQSAWRQIEASREAYQFVKNLVSCKTDFPRPALSGAQPART
jgi:polysaccharide pyruvyl transferase WcaK-like protein